MKKCTLIRPLALIRNICVVYPCESNSESVITQIPKLKNTDIRIRETGSKHEYTVYTEQDKTRFFKLMFEKALSSKLFKTHVCSVQRWMVQYEKDPQ